MTISASYLVTCEFFYGNTGKMVIISYGEFPNFPIDLLGEILNNHPLIITTTYKTITWLTQKIWHSIINYGSNSQKVITFYFGDWISAHRKEVDI